VRKDIELLAIRLISVAFIFSTMMFGEGCATSGKTTIGNGQLDATETMLIRGVVIGAFIARPAAVAPVAAISSALLAGDYVSLLSGDVDKIIEEEAAKLNTSGNVVLKEDIISIKQLAGDLIGAVLEKISITTLTTEQRKVLAKDILTIINETATARL